MSDVGLFSWKGLVYLLVAKYNELKPSWNKLMLSPSTASEATFRDVELTKLRTWSGLSKNRLGKLDICQAAYCNFWDNVPSLFFWINDILELCRGNTTKALTTLKHFPSFQWATWEPKFHPTHNTHHYQWCSKVLWDPPIHEHTCWKIVALTYKFK